MKNNLAFQKSRVKWLKEGDTNSKFFHVVTNRKRSQSTLYGMEISGVWLEEAQEVKEGVKQHFETLFSESHWSRPTLDGIDFNQISAEDNIMLTANFEESEIKEAIWNCDGYKCLGPDGYNFKFFKKFWDLLKSDVYKLVSEFQANGKLARGYNSSFICLIPKRENPVQIGEFRPISLIGNLYKILAKLLAGRLKKVLNSIISDNQSAFLKDRQILDEILILNEVIDDARRTRNPCTIFKIDFEKAFDSVS